MILKEIYLYPDLGEFSDEIIHPFRDQSRSICNFLERSLSAEKFETPTSSWGQLCNVLPPSRASQLPQRIGGGYLLCEAQPDRFKVHVTS
ncbi:hypothetical protein [Pseudomonas brassicacearum]|uniref:hypothetical protein n=1 Tax=Pseudomonas brassicacearum TaxID=930166 RepID=UPI0009B820C2|nr:hypothetical protein [Pseudomonas brassicacearum]